jgi:hypothetical protein
MKKIFVSLKASTALGIFLSVALLCPQLANAAPARNPCYTTTSGTNCIDVGTTTPLPTYQGGAAFTNITTSTDTIIKTSAGTLQGFTVNTVGTSVIFYNNTTCTGAKIGTFTTTVQISIKIDAAFTVGLCATTVGGDITVLWR